MIAENLNNNPVDWYNRYNWTDRNANGVWIRRAGPADGVARRRRQRDPRSRRPERHVTREAAAWLERELVPNVGVHAGFVWRRIAQLVQLNNANRPLSAPSPCRRRFSIPAPTASCRTADDGASIPGFNLSAAALALPVLNELQNTGGHDDFYTLEISASKRATGRWSLNGSFSYRWNKDNASAYFGNSLRALQDVATPNDLINTDGGRYTFTTWAVKINAPLRGALRRADHTVAQEPGRAAVRPYHQRRAANGINYGTARILTEAISTHRQDTITIFDVRVEKAFKLAHRQNLSVFMDGYNLTNTNAATNINWSSGATFLTPSTIVPPRLARFGAKFDW